MSRLLSNWQFAPILHVERSLMTSRQGPVADGTNNDRPVQILTDPYAPNKASSGSIREHSSRTLERTAMSATALRDRAFHSTSAEPHLQARRAIQAEARFEAFNVLNHTNLPEPIAAQPAGPLRLYEPEFQFVGSSTWDERV